MPLKTHIMLMFLQHTLHPILMKNQKKVSKENWRHIKHKLELKEVKQKLKMNYDVFLFLIILKL